MIFVCASVRAHFASLLFFTPEIPTLEFLDEIPDFMREMLNEKEKV